MSWTDNYNMSNRFQITLNLYNNPVNNSNTIWRLTIYLTWARPRDYYIYHATRVRRNNE
jgi:hypothetical protein